MKTTLKLSVITASVLATTVLLTSAAFAGHGYKGENYKGEAAPCPPPERGLQSGFYLGAQAGYDSYRIRNNISLGPTANGTTFTSNPAINATGFVGGLFAGYGGYFSDFYYLAGEILGNYSGASSNVTTTLTDASGTSTFTGNRNVYGSWGLSLYQA